MATPSMERCVREFRGVLTGALPTMDCMKFGVSKGLVRGPKQERRSRVSPVCVQRAGEKNNPLDLDEG